ncbi:MAG: hypothetical protein KBF32_01820 [Chitinophagales bacterium]|nr:hypothetical protein [Chitinophagaceae bacterium]MBP9882110.1 hypothetical protein [Chitinophagales bacterium]
MTTNIPRSLQALCVLAITSLLFSSCLKDSCTKIYTYKLYKPIYMGYDELRSAVKSLPASELNSVGKIYYKAPYLFVSEIDKGIHIIDNSDPSNPQIKAFINVPGCLDIAIRDNILYTDSYIDLVAIDITDPLNVKETSRNQNVFPDRVFANGWTADPIQGVVTGWNIMDTTVEQNCGSMYAVSAFEDAFVSSFSGGTSSGNSAAVTPGIGVAGSLARFAIYNEFLYCLDNASMKLFDISNAAAPDMSNSVQMPWNIETIFPYDHYLFIGSTTGVSIYDNANPSNPVFVSELSHVSSCDPVVVQGNYAYATLRNGTTCQGFTNELEVIDISNLKSPVLKAIVPLTHPFGLGIDGAHLFVCDDNAGLRRMDAQNPLTIEIKQTVSAGETRDVIPLGGLLLLLSTNGLYQFDYSSGELIQLSHLSIGN